MTRKHKTDKELCSKYRKIKVNGKSRDLHRHIMEEHLGRELSRNEVVHHIDGNAFNNDLSNLMLLTRAEHAELHEKAGDYDNRNSVQAKSKARESSRRYWSTHVGKDSKRIAMCDVDGNIIKTFDSAYRTRLEGFDHHHVSACCLGKRKTHKGFCWKFLENGE